MKEFRFIILLLILISKPLFSQLILPNDKIHIGKTYPHIVTDYKEYLTYNDFIIAVKYNYKSEKILLETSNTNDLTFNLSQKYEDLPKKSLVEETIKINNRIYTFFSFWDKKNNKLKLYAREINVEECSFKGEDKLIFELDKKVVSAKITNELRELLSDRFDFKVSKDSKRLLIQYRKQHKRIEEYQINDELGYLILNEDLNVIFQKDIELPHITKKVENIDFAFDDDNNIFLISFIYKDQTLNKVNQQKNINYQIELFKIASKSGQLVSSFIKLSENRHINSMKFFELENNKLICSGYYSPSDEGGKKLYNTNGVFTFNLQSNNDSLIINYYDIPEEIINQNIGKRELKKNNKKDEKAEFLSIMALMPVVAQKYDDGSLILIGEQQYDLANYKNGAYGAALLALNLIPLANLVMLNSSKQKFYYEDIIVTKLNIDGSLAWMKKIAKKQYQSWKEKGLEFKFIEGESDFYLIYMDNFDNLELGLDIAPKDYEDKKPGRLTAVKVNYDTGEIKKISLQGNDHLNFKQLGVKGFRTNAISFFEKDEFFYEANMNNNEDVLMKFNLKE